MSDEFLKVASQEINEELSGISEILGLCKDDEDLAKNAGQIEARMHKIKGLAPMMGKEEIGSLAKSLDHILKKIASGKNIDGFFEPLESSISQMKIAMEKPHDLGQVQKQISDISSKIVD